ncbi:MAG: PAS domain S-box protein [Solirubrobacteraceae bacterium]|nr:PAS domain S-box protein [Solirubrobacteraceae bacterium]
MISPPNSPGSGRPSFADLLELVPDATVGVDTSGAIVLCNAHAADVFGYSAEELLGSPIEVLVAEASAERHAGLRAGFAAEPRNRSMGNHEPLSARRRDGSEFPVEVSLSWVEQEGIVLAAVRDVSDRVDGELLARRLRDELEQSRKLEGLGHLAGGVAHDFNNLLAVILNFSTLAADVVVPGTQLADDIGEIRRAAERGRVLTRKLLIVGGRDTGQPDRLDLAAMLTSLRPLLLSATGAGIELRLELAATRSLHADLAQMEQVVVNLVVNARDAMPRGGTLTIRTEDADLPAYDGVPGAAERLPAGRYVALTVADGGTGMTPDVLGAALDPFFTTKPAGQGSGLGLSTVYRIVRELGGLLSIDSEFGAGTSVVMLLPAYAKVPPADASAAA